MERRLFLIEIYPGTEAEYDKRHDEIWPDMVEALRKSGFSNYSLFRSQTTVIGYVECLPDIKTAGEKMSQEEVSTKWNESMKKIIDYDKTRSLPLFSQVWHMD